jgi:bifunctional non-homologous end joining protein LigD
MGLAQYRAKRNFRSTREPDGRVQRLRPSVGRGRFVIQKHAATRLHYDLRLEVDGVLKSWAVPKGLPVKKGDRRLAVQVEDHPLEYGSFEGTIPEGNYGAGTVMLWDTGRYELLGGEPAAALKEGKLHLWLHGKKLNGEWTLVRMRPREPAEKPQWLLLKTGRDLSPLPPGAEDTSVMSGRSLSRIAGDNDLEWHSDRPLNRAAVRTRKRAQKSHSPPASTASQPRPSRLARRDLPLLEPGFLTPMKSVLARNVPEGSEWLYEIKFDGIRALAAKSHGAVRLFSRNENDLTAKFPQVVRDLARLPADNFLLDGELVVLDETGRSSFQLLQNFGKPGGGSLPLVYYVFDLLVEDGRDVRSTPLIERKARVAQMIQGAGETLRFSAGIEGTAQRILRAMKDRGLEGLVAKRKDSSYTGGRSAHWIKFKWLQEQEFVIGGYTAPQGARSCFGAVLVGYYEGENLRFAGKVGTGFDEKSLERLYRTFQTLKQPTCPFSDQRRRFTRAQAARSTWVRPELGCQVRFAEWTQDGLLRQPSFIGLREDKSPEEVERELPISFAE